jgi:hypothetical protein
MPVLRLHCIPPQGHSPQCNTMQHQHIGALARCRRRRRPRKQLHTVSMQRA